VITYIHLNQKLIAILLRLTFKSSLLSAEERVLGLELSEAFSCGDVFVIQSLLSAEDRIKLSEAFSCGGVFIISAEERVLGLEISEVPFISAEGIELSEAFSCGGVFVAQSAAGWPVESSDDIVHIE
jgi:hypothetical protein